MEDTEQSTDVDDERVPSNITETVLDPLLLANTSPLLES